VTEPIGLSTSWNGPGAGPAILLDQHRELGFRRLEAYAHFTRDELLRLATAASARDMQIASLHAPCPVPTTDLGQRVRYGDWLASTDRAERSSAVDAHRRSIDAAAEIGARAVDLLFERLKSPRVSEPQKVRLAAHLVARASTR
jgi:hypothetical protein